MNSQRQFLFLVCQVPYSLFFVLLPQKTPPKALLPLEHMYLYMFKYKCVFGFILPYSSSDCAISLPDLALCHALSSPLSASCLRVRRLLLLGLLLFREVLSRGRSLPLPLETEEKRVAMGETEKAWEEWSKERGSTISDQKGRIAPLRCLLACLYV